MKHAIMALGIFMLAGGVLFAQQTGNIATVISYQGVLSSSDGNPLPDGEYPVTVTLYGDEGGTKRVWQDTYRAPVRGGIFSIYLGSGTVPLPAPGQMDRPFWIGTRVGESEEMRPLARLTASPYAINIADNAVTTHKLAPGAVTADKVNMDYLAGVTLNGEKISGHGKMLDIRAGKDIDISYDDLTGSLVIGAPEASVEAGGKKGSDRELQGTQQQAWTLRGDGVDVITGGVVGPVAGDWIGTSNNVSFVARTFNQQVMVYQPNGTNTPSIIGGHSSNSSVAGGVANTISGGGIPGYSNRIDGLSHNVISGGIGNVILNSGTASGVIGGGQNNQIGSATTQPAYGTIGGGLFNVVTATYGTVVGGRSGSVSAVHGFVGGGIGNSVSGALGTIPGGDGKVLTASNSSIGGGYHNQIIGNGIAAAIPGGDNLTAQSFGQTVLGVRNIPRGSRTPGSTLTNEPILTVGNGLSGTQSNAFEVSYNGHSTVFHNTSGSIPVIRGSTYTDNVVYAWGSVGQGGAPVSTFGATVTPLGTGWYRVVMSIVDDYGNPVSIDAANSVTATLRSNQQPGGTWNGRCATITASRVVNNTFDVYIANPACGPVDEGFSFKVTGRP